MSHPTDANCIFCKIVAGQIPSFKLLEDDKPSPLWTSTR